MNTIMAVATTARLLEPKASSNRARIRPMPHQAEAATHELQLARPAGLEPATPSLEGSCSIQLSYGRVGRNT
jgi:hypothetical protein